MLGCAGSFGSGYSDGCDDAEQVGFGNGQTDCIQGDDFDPTLEPLPTADRYEEGLESGWQDCYRPAYRDGWSGAGCPL